MKIFCSDIKSAIDKAANQTNSVDRCQINALGAIWGCGYDAGFPDKIVGCVTVLGLVRHPRNLSFLKESCSINL